MYVAASTAQSGY